MTQSEHLALRGRFVLLVDHGSRSPVANESLVAIATQLQAFLRTSEAGTVVACGHMELAKPDIVDALTDLVKRGAEEVLVIPCMLSRGRHVSEDIPRILSQARERLGVRLRLADPLSELPGFIEFLAGALDFEQGA